MPGILYRAAHAWDVFRGRPPQRGTRTVFAAAARDRTAGSWMRSLMSPDDELKGDLSVMRAGGRQACRDNPVAERYLQLLIDNVLGETGMTLTAQYRDSQDNLDKALNDQVEGAWNEWCRGPVTVDGQFNFYGLSDLLLESTAKDGEVFPKLFRGFGDNPYGLGLQVIDPDLVDEHASQAASRTTNAVRLGVEVNSRGQRVGYWIHDYVGYAADSFGGRHYFESARDVLHYGRPRRANQTRYYTWFHTVLQDLYEVYEYIRAELVAARIGSSAAGVWEDMDPEAPGKAGGTGGQGSVVEFEPGMIVTAPQGKKLSSWTPTHPTDAFPEFVKSSLRRIAGGLGVSYSSLANDPSDASYSNDRSGLIKERKRWLKLQEHWIAGFQTPVFNTFLEQAVLQGRLPIEVLPPSGIAAPVKWTGPRWDWVDPRNAAQGKVLELKYKLTSPQRVAAERGLVLEDIFEEWQEAERLADQYGIELLPPDDPDAGNAGELDDEAHEESSNGKANGTNGTKPATARPARRPKSRIGARY